MWVEQEQRQANCWFVFLLSVPALDQEEGHAFCLLLGPTKRYNNTELSNGSLSEGKVILLWRPYRSCLSKLPDSSVYENVRQSVSDNPSSNVELRRHLQFTFWVLQSNVACVWRKKDLSRSLKSPCMKFSLWSLKSLQISKNEWFKSQLYEHTPSSEN